MKRLVLVTQEVALQRSPAAEDPGTLVATQIFFVGVQVFLEVELTTEALTAHVTFKHLLSDFSWQRILGVGGCSCVVFLSNVCRIQLDESVSYSLAWTAHFRVVFVCTFGLAHQGSGRNTLFEDSFMVDNGHKRRVLYAGERSSLTQMQSHHTHKKLHEFTLSTG